MNDKTGDKLVKKTNRRVQRLVRRVEMIKIKYQWRTLPKHERPVQFSSAHVHRWNIHEEIANSITHGIGVLLGVAALVLLVVYASIYGNIYDIVSGAIFGLSLIIAYVSSMLYHAILYPPLKRIFRILDHSSIFILIAGTYTPFCLVTLRGDLGWTLLGVIWASAALGVLLKIFFVDEYELLSTIVYLVMGWIGVTCVFQLVHALPLGAILLLIAGGLFYSFGIIFFLLERIPFFHTIWHLFVLAGSISHFFAVLLYVMPVKT